MLKLNNISVNYGAIEALKQVTIEVSKGSIVGLIGANGAGKSTCLKTISGIVNPTEGEVLFEGNNLTNMRIEQRVSLGIIHLLEGRRLFGDQIVEDNLLLGAYLQLKKKNNTVYEEIEKIYERFPILHQRRKQLAGTLSGGEQQMLIIAQALLAKPRLLLMDEPSMGLAPKIVEDLFNYIVELKEAGLTILLVEQLATKAFSVADHIYILQLGKIVASEPCQSLSTKDVKALINMYLGDDSTY